MSWQARKWADDQRPRTAMCKWILLSLAHFANKHGESWPGLDSLVEYSLASKNTVKAAIKILIEDKEIFDTGKRRGETGRVPVYQLPLNETSNGPVMGQQWASNETKSGPIVIGESVPIPDPGSLNHIDDGKSWDPKLAPPAHMKSSSSISLDWIKEAEKDPFWPEYLRFCKSRNGSPTRKGWETWRAKQVVVKPSAPKKPKKVKPLLPRTSDEERARIAKSNAEAMTAFKAKYNAA
jgi:Helix-turn-helix domain